MGQDCRSQGLGGTRRLRAGLLLLGVCTLLGVPGSAEARSAAGEVAYERGARALRMGDDPAAVGYLETAAAADPDDVEILGLYANALLRVGRFSDARPVLVQLRTLAPDMPGLSFREGMVAFRTGDLDAARSHLENAVRENPNDARAHLFLGATLSDQGDQATAETHLRRAGSLDSDPELQSAVSYRLGVVAARREDWDAAGRFFRDVEAQAPGSSLAQAADAYSRARAGGGAGVSKPWQVYAKAGMAWDTNGNLVGRGVIPRAAGLERESDFRGSLDVGGYYTVLDTEHFRGRIGHDSAFTFHADLHNFDVYSSRTWAEGRTKFADGAGGQFGADLRFTYEYSLADYEDFRRSYVIEPAIWYNPAPGLLARVFYRYADRDYFLASRFRPLDRDGQLKTLGADLYVPVPDLISQGNGFLRVGYRNRVESTSGDNFDSHGNAGLLTLGLPLPWELFAVAHGHYERRRFARPSILEPGRGRRDDHIRQLSFSLRRPINQYLTAEVSYRRTNWSSNVRTFDFHRSIYGANVTFRY